MFSFSLLFLPEINLEDKKDFVFGFEELENNLHPSLQRRLFNYIAEYAKNNGCYFFITTHSSIVIDLFNSNNDAQILHVFKQGDSSVVKSIIDQTGNRNILKDLDYKASDLLLSNGVIWVEGPSDALYLELFIELERIEHKKSEIVKLNYTIQSLSTAIWKYAGFTDFDWDKVNASIENQIISLAKVNYNHLIIIDKDTNYEDKAPSDYKSFANGTGKNKAKLIYESLLFSNQKESNLENNWGATKDGKLNFLITPGTFETYLEYFINNKGKDAFKKYFQSNKNEGYFEKRRMGPNSSISKVELASEICMFIRNEKVTLNDIAPERSNLLETIKRLYATIKDWK